LSLSPDFDGSKWTFTSLQEPGQPENVREISDDTNKSSGKERIYVRETEHAAVPLVRKPDEFETGTREGTLGSRGGRVPLARSISLRLFGEGRNSRNAGDSHNAQAQLK
jgi:hypothetical protein